MHYLFANYDKKQYFRPIALGSPHGTINSRVGPCVPPTHREWLAIYLEMIEAVPDTQREAEKHLGELPSWAGDRTAIIRQDDHSGTMCPEELQALAALGGTSLPAYRTIRDSYVDVTDLVRARMEIRLSQVRAAKEEADEQRTRKIFNYAYGISSHEPLRAEVLQALQDCLTSVAKRYAYTTELLDGHVPSWTSLPPRRSPTQAVTPELRSMVLGMGKDLRLMTELLNKQAHILTPPAQPDTLSGPAA